MVGGKSQNHPLPQREAIPNITGNTAWALLTTDAWSDYANTPANSTKYGKLYNWYAVADTRNIAPSGWHVSTDAEWSKLETYVAANLCASPNVPKALAATTDWAVYSGSSYIGNDLTRNNSTLFNALPGGYHDKNGNFGDLGTSGYWWSATDFDASTAWMSGLYSFANYVGRYNVSKQLGYSVRCVKIIDEPVLSFQVSVIFVTDAKRDFLSVEPYRTLEAVKANDQYLAALVSLAKGNKADAEVYCKSAKEIYPFMIRLFIKD